MHEDTVSMSTIGQLMTGVGFKMINIQQMLKKAEYLGVRPVLRAFKTFMESLNVDSQFYKLCMNTFQDLVNEEVRAESQQVST